MSDAPSWRIRLERPGDGPGIEALAALAFGPGRYAKSAYRLREGVQPDSRLGFVAEDSANARLLGSVRFWPIAVGGSASLLLGPLAVQPALRGRGIGIALMQHGIEAARTHGYATVLLVGDEPYYARVGFARLPPRVRFPGPVDPTRVLGLSLVSGALLSLSGTAARARIDAPVSAQATALGKI
jgi:predicted N-acetyltransferase YhbS